MGQYWLSIKLIILSLLSSEIPAGSVVDTVRPHPVKGKGYKKVFMRLYNDGRRRMKKIFPIFM